MTTRSRQGYATREPATTVARNVMVVCPPKRADVVRDLLDQTQANTAIVGVNPQLESAIRELDVSAVDLVVLDMAVIVDADDLGWLRHLLIWPTMPLSIIIASTVQDHARLNALWPLETPVLIVDSPSAAATLAATRDLFRPPIARHRSRYRSAGSQQESSTAGQHGASHVPVDLQNEVVELFLHGAVSGEIAARLRLSEDAVARHILAILHRLGARNRGELRSIIVARARRAATPRNEEATAMTPANPSSLH